MFGMLADAHAGEFAVGQTGYVLAAPDDFVADTAPAGSSGVWLRLKNSAGDTWVQVNGGADDATLASLATEYEETFKPAVTRFRRRQNKWVALDGVRCIYRMYGARAADENVTLHALSFVEHGVKMVVHGFTSRRDAEPLKQILLSVKSAGRAAAAVAPAPAAAERPSSAPTAEAKRVAPKPGPAFSQSNPKPSPGRKTTVAAGYRLYRDKALAVEFAVPEKWESEQIAGLEKGITWSGAPGMDEWEASINLHVMARSASDYKDLDASVAAVRDEVNVDPAARILREDASSLGGMSCFVLDVAEEGGGEDAYHYRHVLVQRPEKIGWFSVAAPERIWKKKVELHVEQLLRTLAPLSE